MQFVDQKQRIDENQILAYIKEVTSMKYEFVHQICEIFP